MNLTTLTATTRAQKSLVLGRILVFGPSVVAIVVSVAIGFLVVWPKFNEVLKLRESNKTLEATAGKLEKKASELAVLDKNKLKRQLTAAEQLLPSDKNIFTFIRQIEEVRNSSGVVITNLSVGSVGQFKTDPAAKVDGSSAGVPPAPAVAVAPAGGDADLAASAGVGTVDMKLSLTSDYRSINQFLNNVYALARVTLVKDLAFSTGTEGQLTTTLTVGSLWQVLPSELPSVEAPLTALGRAQADLLAKVEETGAVSAPVVVPDVPIGKGDIFTPY